MSGNFTAALASAGSVSLANPVTITLGDGGASGTFFPPTLTLTTDLPSATFRYRPAAGADPSTVTISATNDGGLSNPASVTYGVSGTAAVATALTITGPSSGTIGSESSTFTVALSPTGSVLPAACDPAGGVLVVTLAYTGTDPSDLLRLTDSELAEGGGSMLARQALSGDTPSFTFVYRAATAGARTIAPSFDVPAARPGPDADHLHRHGGPDGSRTDRRDRGVLRRRLPGHHRPGRHPGGEPDRGWDQLLPRRLRPHLLGQPGEHLDER